MIIFVKHVHKKKVVIELTVLIFTTEGKDPIQFKLVAKWLIHLVGVNDLVRSYVIGNIAAVPQGKMKRQT